MGYLSPQAHITSHVHAIPQSHAPLAFFIRALDFTSLLRSTSSNRVTSSRDSAASCAFFVFVLASRLTSQAYFIPQATSRHKLRCAPTGFHHVTSSRDSTVSRARGFFHPRA